ncbi:hypothetical protein [Pyrobaculum aerophilum]|uniref:Uncharacterized protein n=1 Tax=Pyrobaculum aerophilum TaxID=13773 RepID=A0A371R4X9_9CREN|nr:hypothetical protein [Pyrobaculum aerophilum]RFA95965.1 hypothetical protein CGL51_06555 [Pyrobaculum aerophilum]RFA99114.1 hypothetical protein CGL52_05205 [Pyrobaculum aerophilum]
MEVSDLRRGFLGLIIGAPILFFMALGLLYAANLTNYYEELPTGVRYNPAAMMAMAIIAIIGGALLTYVSWTFWRGYYVALKDRVAAVGALVLLLGYIVFFLFLPAAMAGNIGGVLAAVMVGIALIFVGYVLAFIIPAYRFYALTKDGVFLVAVILYALFFLFLITVYIAWILMYVGLSRIGERRASESAGPGISA